MTEELIDDVLPTVEYVAYCRRFESASAITESRRRLAAVTRKNASTTAAFRSLLQDKSPGTYTFLISREFLRGTPRAQAEQRVANLVSDLEEHEKLLLLSANDLKPRRGAQPDEHVSRLVRGAISSWLRNVGQFPKASSGGPFVRFCEELGKLARVDATFDKIKIELDKW